MRAVRLVGRRMGMVPQDASISAQVHLLVLVTWS
jgi:hypothetical protein